MRQDFARIAPYVAAKLISYILSILSVPILTSLFTVNGFGSISIVDAEINLLISFFLLGMPQSYIRFYNNYLIKGEIFALNFNYLIIIMIISITCFFFSFFILNAYNVFYRLILIMIVTMSVFVQQMASVLRAKEKVWFHAFFLCVNESLSYLLPIFLIFILGASPENFFLGKFVACFMLLVLILSVLNKDFNFSSFRLEIIREMLFFGVPLLLVSLGVVVFSMGDRFVIDFLLGKESVAIYSVSSKIAHSLQQVLIFPVNMVLFPYYIKTWEQKGRESTEELLTKWLNAYIFIAIGMILLSFSLRNELIMLLANNKYSEGANLIPILLTGLLVNGCYYFISASFFLQKQTTKLGIILIASSVLNIIIVFFLGAWKDIGGVAIGTVFSNLIFFLVILFSGGKEIKVIFDLRKCARFVFFGLWIGWGVNSFISFSDTVFSILVKGVTVIFLYTLTNYRLIVSTFSGP